MRQKLLKEIISSIEDSLMRKFSNFPRIKKVLESWPWFFLFLSCALFPLQLKYEQQINREGFLDHTIAFALFVLLPALLILLAIFVKRKTIVILGATVIYGLLFFTNSITIPRYNGRGYSAYDAYAKECKRLPKPVIYNQDYWNIWLHWAKLKLYNQDGSPKEGVIGDAKSSDIPFYYSKKLNKKIEDKWRYQEKIEETWWGKRITRERYNDDIHFATTITNYYKGRIFRFGIDKIGFDFREMECANFERDDCRDVVGSCSLVGTRDDL